MLVKELLSVLSVWLACACVYVPAGMSVGITAAQPVCCVEEDAGSNSAPSEGKGELNLHGPKVH